MKTLNSFFNRKSDSTSISTFEEFAMNRNLMSNVRGGGDGGAVIILDDDPHDPTTTTNPPKDADKNP
ncbi:MAG TPA: hypothetical protein VE912_02325 [Bacteroidales bacterium]|nr:hypothetical protein [Bacteroidales bacterium]